MTKLGLIRNVGIAQVYQTLGRLEQEGKVSDAQASVGASQRGTDIEVWATDRAIKELSRPFGRRDIAMEVLTHQVLSQ